MNFLDEDGLNTLWQQVKSLVSKNLASATTQLNNLCQRLLPDNSKSIICTDAENPDTQGRLVGITGTQHGTCTYLGIPSTYYFYADTQTTGTLLIIGQGVGTAAAATHPSIAIYIRTDTNTWLKQ